MSNSAICVLGGTGFVGHSLIARLATGRQQLRVATRYREDHRDLLVNPNLELIKCDVHDPRTLDMLVNGCSTIINLVGILNESGHDGKGFYRAHSELTDSVVAACVRNKVSRLVYLSALNADSEKGPSHYLRSKGEAEKIIRRAGADLVFNILQPSVIFGPNDSFTNRFARLLAVLPVFPLAMPRTRMAPVYVEDVVSTIMRCLGDQKLNGKTLQLGGPQVYSLKEIVQLIAKSMGRRRLVIGLPDGLSRIQASVLEYLPGKPFSRDNFRSLQAHSICTDDSFARLGIKPDSFARLIPRWLAPAANIDRLDITRQRAGRH